VQSAKSSFEGEAALAKFQKNRCCTVAGEKYPGRLGNSRKGEGFSGKFLVKKYKLSIGGGGILLTFVKKGLPITLGGEK